MANANELNWYAPIFKTWQVKLLGPKPTADQLAQIHRLGAKPGKQALASAMALRDCGVTNPQIILACGNPQLNKMRGFITDVLLRREPVSQTPEGHTVYKLTVTPKGAQRIKTAEARLAKAEAEGNNVQPDAEGKVTKLKKAGGKAAVKAARKAKVKAAAKPAAEAEAAPEAAQAAETVPEADTDNANAA